MLSFSGFYHEVTRLDRDNYVNVDYDHIAIYEHSFYGRVTGYKKKEYIRCDRTKISQKNFTTDQHSIVTKGCQRIGNYDGDSILHYPTSLKLQVNQTGRWEDKKLTVLTLNEKAHSLCENGRCNPGQRERLSVHDVSDIAFRYNTSCGNRMLLSR